MEQSSQQQSRFTGFEASPLDLFTASKWTESERKLNSDQPQAYFFGRKIIERILAQSGCMGLRIFYATDPANGRRHLLVVGADAAQNNQLPPLRRPRPQAADKSAAPAEATPMASQEYIIAEMAVPCPDQCGQNDELNS